MYVYNKSIVLFTKYFIVLLCLIDLSSKNYYDAKRDKENDPRKNEFLLHLRLKIVVLSFSLLFVGMRMLITLISAAKRKRQRAY